MLARFAPHFTILEIKEGCCRLVLYLSVLQIFGAGSVAQMVLSNWKFGNFFSVNFSWGIGVTLGCYWAGGVSGKQKPQMIRSDERLALETSSLESFFGGQFTFNNSP